MCDVIQRYSFTFHAQLLKEHITTLLTPCNRICMGKIAIIYKISIKKQRPKGSEKASSAISYTSGLSIKLEVAGEIRRKKDDEKVEGGIS